MLGNGLLIAPQRGQRPVARRMRIRHRLQRREGLRRNQEKRLLRLQIAHSLCEVRSVNVRHKTKGDIALAVVFQGLISHHRSKIRPAYANVNDVTNRLASVSLPLTAADTIGKRSHLVQHRMHPGHNIPTLNKNRLALRRSQRDVKNGAIFRDIDLFSTAHRIDPLPQPGLLGQLNEKLQRLVRDAVLGVIKKDPTRLNRESLAALRVFRKHLFEIFPLNLLMMRLEGLPRRALTEWYRFGHLFTPRTLCPAQSNYYFWDNN